ncbi:MAG: hypothetical protein QOJ44_1463 [Acidimicrobiaceae bacterium]|jgi:hypothetical protein|nr:hypothetical protein [Acidimicrobiaceae bacterium]
MVWQTQSGKGSPSAASLVPAQGLGFGAVLRIALAVVSMTAPGRNPPWSTWRSRERGDRACQAPRIATTQSAASTTARNTALITTSAPTKRMAPIIAVSTTDTLPTRPDRVTGRPLSTNWNGKGAPGPVDGIFMLAAIASAARPKSVVATGH